MIPYVGELAALLTSLLFAATSTFFTLASRRVGSVVLNRTRLVVAVLLVTAAHLLIQVPLPFQAAPERWLWFTLSGLAGLVLGDAFLYQAFVWIGPRLTMLMMALHPAIAILLAWLFLGESLTLVQLFGIALTLSGVAWVVTDRAAPVDQPAADRRQYLLGLLYGLGAATGQASGLVLARPGLADGFPALSGTLIRMFTAAIFLWAYTLLRRQVRPTLQTLASRPQALRYILAGSITGPFLGVTFSLFAIQNAEVGVASTLMALPPVILLPISRFIFKEQLGWRAITGTLLAIAGVGVLFLV
ncbi:MAG: DMT family transporter [Chloroflexota bacterium]